MKQLWVFSVVFVLLGTLTSTASAQAPPEHQLPQAVLDALNHGQEFDVLSVDPDTLTTVPEPSWKILKEVTVVDPAVRARVVTAITDAVANPGQPRHCFLPRHAIRTNYDHKTYVLVICFQCHWVYIYVDGKREQELPIGPSARAVLDQILH
jgi:hypothetical protein